ncbi:DUF5710 domain-containing protein [Methylobacterium hispanicum]|nr:DUF5710 domain-containing protein [Methylobacterium hispanicum]
MAVRHVVVWSEVVALTSAVEQLHDAVGGPLPTGHPMRGPFERRYAMGRGSVNGKPFVAELVDDPTRTLYRHECRAVGHMLTKPEEDAVGRSMRRAPAREIDIREGTEPVALTERNLWRSTQELGRTYIVVANGANEPAKRLGAMWESGRRCWFVMAGVDLEPFERLGMTPRPRPEWRRLRDVPPAWKERAKELGARWFDRGWYLDVSVADAEVVRILREDLGVGIMETLDDLWDWMSVHDINAQPGPDAFPEWLPPAEIPVRAPAP